MNFATGLTHGLTDLFAATRGLVLLRQYGVAPSFGASASSWAESGFAPPPEPKRSAHLTGRETDVLQRIAKGFTLAEVAAQLGVSRHTVSDHAKAVYRKLDVGSRAEAAVAASRLGLA
jgi:DNA-binding NarL/FixJ family response regulator